VCGRCRSVPAAALAEERKWTRFPNAHALRVPMDFSAYGLYAPQRLDKNGAVHKSAWRDSLIRQQPARPQPTVRSDFVKSEESNVEASRADLIDSIGRFLNS